MWKLKHTPCTVYTRLNKKHNKLLIINSLVPGLPTVYSKMEGKVQELITWVATEWGEAPDWKSNLQTISRSVHTSSKHLWSKNLALLPTCSYNIDRYPKASFIKGCGRMGTKIEYWKSSMCFHAQQPINSKVAAKSCKGGKMPPFAPLPKWSSEVHVRNW